MGWQFSLYALGLGCSAILAAIVAYLTWQERPKVGATTIAVHAVAYVLWSLTQSILVASSSLHVALGALMVTGAAITVATITWFVFALQFTGRSDRVTGRLVAALLVEPAAFTALMVTNEPYGPHELVVIGPRIVDEGARLTLTYAWGPLVWVHAAYLGSIAVAGLWVLFSKFLASRNVYRKRTFVFIVGGTVLITTTLLDLTSYSPAHLTLTPLVFLLVGGFATFTVTSVRTLRMLPVDRVLAALGSRSKNLTPVARNTIIEEMEDGMVVLDHAGRIVDINPNGRSILEAGDDRVVGRRLTAVVDPDVPEAESSPIQEGRVVPGEYSGIWIATDDGESRCFDVECTELRAADDWPAGYVLLIHDVTERERRKERLESRTLELERRNEQLDDFASVVSHDLRNPLNVAAGHLDLGIESGDQEHFDRVRSAHDRMGAIVDDVLTMARQARAMGETEVVEVAAVAREAWHHVDSTEVSLEVDLELAVDGDPGRLSQLFENLYRNAIEHGGDGVCVRVVGIDDGFAVEDDGPGIPADKRETVFERGYSTSTDGTGFGLSIVQSVVDAHGWDVRLTEGRDGGARFEITGVEATSSDGSVRVGGQ